MSSSSTADAARDDRKRMENALFRALHAQLRSKEKRPLLRETESAVWLTWYPTGEPPLEYRIEQEAWWNPATEEHAAELATRLLTGLRAALQHRSEAAQRA